MPSKTLKKEIRYTILEIVEQHGTETNDLLYCRLKREYPDLCPHEFSDAINQLQTLEMLTSFDGGHDWIFEITREGICALAKQ